MRGSCPPGIDRVLPVQKCRSIRVAYSDMLLHRLVQRIGGPAATIKTVETEPRGCLCVAIDQRRPKQFHVVLFGKGNIAIHGAEVKPVLLRLGKPHWDDRNRPVELSANGFSKPRILAPIPALDGAANPDAELVGILAQGFALFWRAGCSGRSRGEQSDRKQCPKQPA